MRVIVVSREQAVGGVKAERAICLELLLREPLVERGLVRKAAVARLIVEDVIVLVAGQRSLDVDKDAPAAGRIADVSDRAMRTVMLRRGAGFVDKLCRLRGPAWQFFPTAGQS